MENDFRIKKIKAIKTQVVVTTGTNWKLTSHDSDNDEDELEIL